MSETVEIQRRALSERCAQLTSQKGDLQRENQELRAELDRGRKLLGMFHQLTPALLVRREDTYEIWQNGVGRSIRCLQCGQGSYNTDHIEAPYCIFCNLHLSESVPDEVEEE